MRRADRLFQIVQYLRGGRLVTAQGLAERLEVSTRTIYRDIADLQGTGVPIEGEAGVGYVMAAGFDLPPLMFTRDEVTALVAGARLLQAFGGAEMGRAAEEALVKIRAVLPEAEQGPARDVALAAIGIGFDAPLRDRLDVLQSAIDGAFRLHLSYRDEAGVLTARSVRPLGQLFWGKVWTLIAWCELREDFRMFRADRIADMTPGDRFRSERGKRLVDFYARVEAEPRAADHGPLPFRRP
ncbi:helix-turn-helix transcriptional regulator [Roseicyclus marinus]|uniref:helix-turn-helix transcriptional regulator n=1 Tax=Roseicyclus marinus TaxID=2161673 RepID=UPI00241085EC|nr:YafY family protein [Roseicyclus marinus]MDG3042397.1 YafY family protein [Roseicyclus marinus]